MEIELFHFLVRDFDFLLIDALIKSCRHVQAASADSELVELVHVALPPSTFSQARAIIPLAVPSDCPSFSQPLFDQADLGQISRLPENVRGRSSRAIHASSIELP